MNEQELKTMWKANPSAPLPQAPAMPWLDDAGSFERRIRRRNLREYAAGGFGIVCSLLAAWFMPAPLAQLGCVLNAIGCIVVLSQLHRRASSERPSPQGYVLPSLDFYRRSLVRQRDALKSAWLWYVLPFAPGIVLYRYGLETMPGRHGSAGIDLAVDLGIAAMAMAIAWLNRRAALHLQQKIDELDAPG